MTSTVYIVVHFVLNEYVVLLIIEINELLKGTVLFFTHTILFHPIQEKGGLFVESIIRIPF